jgi:hypothetical protein
MKEGEGEAIIITKDVDKLVDEALEAPIPQDIQEELDQT